MDVGTSCAPAWRDKHWFPVASVRELDPLRPTPVRIDGQALVVWCAPEPLSGAEVRRRKRAPASPDDGDWRVFEDVCPHRLAPLSEGRIEPKTGRIQCAYHGWEFDAEGRCHTIPSMDIESCERHCSQKESCAVAFPSKVFYGLVWAWLGKGDPQGSPADALSGSDLEGEMITKTYTRDLAYGYDTLMENLMDPSHIPFAHHGLQGTRDDATPIQMKMLGGGAGIKFEFDDRTMGKNRHCTFTLLSPFLAYYRGKFEGKADPWKLNFVCVPVAPGESRLILIYTDKPGEGHRSMINRLPAWVVHLFANKFLDSDLAFLHYQERTLRSAPRSADKFQTAYFMPAKSDQSIAEWRRWLRREGARCVTAEYAAEVPPSPPRPALFDRYNQHTAHCLHCQEALRSMAAWQRRCLFFGVGALVLDRWRVGPWRLWLAVELLAAGLYAGLRSTAKYFHVGGYEHYKT